MSRYYFRGNDVYHATDRYGERCGGRMNPRLDDHKRVFVCERCRHIELRADIEYRQQRANQTVGGIVPWQ